MESCDSFLSFSNCSSSGSDDIRRLDQVQGKMLQKLVGSLRDGGLQYQRAASSARGTKATARIFSFRKASWQTARLSSSKTSGTTSGPALRVPCVHGECPATALNRMTPSSSKRRMAARSAAVPPAKAERPTVDTVRFYNKGGVNGTGKVYAGLELCRLGGVSRRGYKRAMKEEADCSRPLSQVKGLYG
jgi:hypothetical protein